MVLTTVGVLAVMLNVLLYGFYAQHLDAAFRRGADATPSVDSARGALIAAQVAVAPVVALGLLMMTPAVSRTRPAARIAGASRVTVAVGELVPSLTVIALVTGVGGAGPTWFVAAHHPVPLVAFAVLALTAAGAGLVAVAVHGSVVTAVRAIDLPPLLARMVALVVSFGAVGVLLGEFLATTARSEPSVVLRVLAVVWGGQSDSLGLRALAGASILLLGATSVVTVARLLERDEGAFSRFVRIVGARSVGVPNALVNAVARETLLLLRHPVGQTTTAAAIGLATMLVAGSRAGMVPASVAVSAFAMLFSANAETAFGRSADWRWVRQLGHLPPRRFVLEQYLGVIPVGLLCTVVASTVALTPVAGGTAATWGELAATVVLFLSLSAIAYLAGVLLPYDDAAPAAVMATSMVTISIEGALLWGTSMLAPPGTVAAAAMELAAAIGALAAASVVTGRRGRR